MNALLASTRARIGPAPRSPSFARANRADPPSWMSRTDGLRSLYADQALLLCEGEVVWGVVLQTNQQMFGPGNHDHPAFVIYSPDPVFDAAPDRLDEIANEMLALRKTEPKVRELAEIPTWLAQTTDRTPKKTLPRPLARDREVHAGVTMLHRRHLPTRLLGSRIVPLLFHPSTPWVLPLASAAWSDELRSAWLDLAANVE